MRVVRTWRLERIGDKMRRLVFDGMVVDWNRLTSLSRFSMDLLLMHFPEVLHLINQFNLSCNDIKEVERDGCVCMWVDSMCARAHTHTHTHTHNSN